MTKVYTHGGLTGPNETDYVSLVEIADMANVSRARAFQLAQAATFPKPVIVTRSGRIWLRRVVQEWLDSRVDKRE